MMSTVRQTVEDTARQIDQSIDALGKRLENGGAMIAQCSDDGHRAKLEAAYRSISGHRHCLMVAREVIRLHLDATTE